ncbi:MAG TPA: site-2 protease family protein [Actinomycetaceae bacterium]|nr:site-2 protease family protein [Actinomycetaceae bacterium]
MERRAWRIGRIGRTPLYLDRSWPIGVLLLVSVYFSSLTRDGLPVGRALGLAAVATFGLFLSVLVHEVSHGIAGHALKRPPRSYTLTLWGGYTAFRGPERGPGTMALIAVAGPVSNLALSALIWLLSVLLTSTNPRAAQEIVPYLWPIAVVNVLMGLFNLAPGLPMDGGHLVHALAWKITGNRDRGMLVASWAGVLLAGAVGVLALYELVIGGGALAGNGFWLLIIAFFLWSGAQNSLRVARARLSVADLDLRSVMTEVAIVPATAPVSHVPSRGAVLHDGGRVVAIAMPDDLAAVPDPSLPAHAVGRVLHPSAVLTAAKGSEAAGALGAAAPHSDVVVLVSEGRAWIGRVADLARHFESRRSASRRR